MHLHKIIFLSTLSLRRATLLIFTARQAAIHFYPRSPCGERLYSIIDKCELNVFLSTLSLRRATDIIILDEYQKEISIHALLAESDRTRTGPALRGPYFYPRSPCGERRMRRCTVAGSCHFYPRSPCGERPHSAGPWQEGCRDFYPRSPCGERRNTGLVDTARQTISIHALLAESDAPVFNRAVVTFQFLSTLSLRRATLSA